MKPKMTVGAGPLGLTIFVLLILGIGLVIGLIGYKAQLQLNGIVKEQGKLAEANAQLRLQLSEELRSQAATLTGDLQAEISQLIAEQERQSRHINSIQATINEHRQRLAVLSRTDRRDWLFAEVEYLLRLANQRVLMEKDTVAAQVLLSNADDILAELKDISLYPLRSALALDLAALGAAANIDTQSVYLRLQVLASQMENLPLFVLPATTTVPSIETDTKGWRSQLDKGIEVALNKFGDYVVISHREEKYNPIISGEWESLARQNFRMILEQSQSALLSGNTELYKQSLQKALYWVERFFTLNEKAIVALNIELNSLLKIDVSPSLPDISRSLIAVKNKIKSRHEARTKLISASGSDGE